jgi:hypothetical protein
VSKREILRSPLSSANVQTAWRYTSTRYDFMVVCLINDKGKVIIFDSAIIG